jgi:hypothetical protein
MKIRTNLKAGGTNINHSQPVRGLRVKSNVKAGGKNLNHNQAVAR